MKLNLKVWRQAGANQGGGFQMYEVDGLLPEMSILEALDVLNEQLTKKGQDAVAFDSDCREGICGTCGLVINGMAHGAKRSCTTCELRLRSYKDGATITIEPFRAKGFPIIKDLVVDRSAFDRIIAAGGFVSIRTGNAPEANDIPIPKDDAELSMDAAACIGCGACVAACPNASAMLFVSAKISHLGLLPQGQPERYIRVRDMVAQMDAEEFGTCTNHGECEAACPKGIKMENIARMNRDYLKASLTYRPATSGGGGAG